MITCIFQFSIDLGLHFLIWSTFSYAYTYFAAKLDMMCDRIPVPICVSTLVVESLVVDHVYRSCLVSLAGYDTWGRLDHFRMVDFNIILGMDWLSS